MMAQNELTVDRGYEIARQQRAGTVIVMGPTAARERRVEALPYQDISKLPGPWSWLGFDLGFEPSLWSIWIADIAKRVSGEDPSRADWLWLNSPASSLASVQQWLADLAKDRAANARPVAFIPCKGKLGFFGWRNQ